MQNASPPARDSATRNMTIPLAKGDSFRSNLTYRSRKFFPVVSLSVLTCSHDFQTSRVSGLASGSSCATRSTIGCNATDARSAGCARLDLPDGSRCASEQAWQVPALRHDACVEGAGPYRIWVPCRCGASRAAPGRYGSVDAARDRSRGKPVTHYEVVHEKLIHLFVVSQDLEFFAHIHPVFDGKAFHIQTRLPQAGMYRLLADYYPAGSVPQLSLSTLYVAGPHSPAHLKSSVAPQACANLTAALRMEPNNPSPASKRASSLT